MPNNDIKIVFFGTPHFVAPVLQTLTQHFQVQAVVSAPDKPEGRKQELSPSPIAQLAQKNNILTLKPEKLDEEFIKNHLSILDSDIFIVAAYGKLIPQKLLDVPKYGALNIHPSLLPKYRGPAPIQNTILNGEKISGVTIIKIDDKMDHGPIITTKKIILSDHDTFDTLSKKMFKEGVKLLIKIILNFIAGKLPLKKQDDQQATYTKLIKKEDGYFDIGNPPFQDQLNRMIRAYYPWPTAWTRWHDKVVKFLPNQMVQMEGKKPTKLEDFLRGHPNFPIKNLL